MRRHGLLLLVLVLSTVPALARTPIHDRRPPPLAAAIEPGLHAGTLVLAFHNAGDEPLALPIRVRAGVIDYDWLTVELTNGTTTRTLDFTHERTKASIETVTIPAFGTHVERIDLDALTADLPRGPYDVHVRWRSDVLNADAHTTTMLEYFRCGLAYAPPPPPPPAPSKLPYLLGGLALAGLVVGWRLAKRPGSDDARVPHCAP
jgi:hypothetical protein